MSSTLVAALHQEERSIIAELRASRPYQRLEGIRSLLELYDAQPSVAVPLNGVSAPEPERPSAVIRPIAAAAPPAAAIPMPGPTIADDAVADAVRVSAVSQGPIGFEAAPEPASVVSSVRAALLGIGKP
jgi:hypothetical protein